MQFYLKSSFDGYDKFAEMNYGLASRVCARIHYLGRCPEMPVYQGFQGMRDDNE